MAYKVVKTRAEKGDDEENYQLSRELPEKIQLNKVKSVNFRRWIGLIG